MNSIPPNVAESFALPIRVRGTRARLEALRSEARALHLHSVALRRAQEHEPALADTHAERLATMGRLTASIAHEVNQPITAVVTNAQAALRWLDADSPDLNEIREALERILNAGKRAGGVIAGIRSLVRKTPPHRESVDINRAIAEVMTLTRAEATKNQVAVRTQLAEGLPLIEADRVQLQQVMLNLIVNAVEAMTGGGEDPRELLISTQNIIDGVLVTVRDTGPGLDPETVKHAFDSFHTTKPGGMGMGLSISRSIVEAHGGRLWASANVPRGAAFRFTLPANA